MRLVLRGSRLTVVAAAFAMLSAVPMSALLLLHDLDNDDRCSPSAGLHDAGAHRIRADAALADSPHCVICHLWQSGGRFREPNLPSTLTSFIDFGLVAKTHVREPGLVATDSRPARAPPAS